MGKTKVLRSRYFACILYPENPYHCELLQFLRETHTGFYIIHYSDSDLCQLPSVGFISEHHEDGCKPHIHCILEFRNARTESGLIKHFPHVRYYKDEYSKQFFTLYDIPYTDLPLQEVVKPVVEHWEALTDVYAYAEYILHKDFKSVVSGKKMYEVSDIQMLNSDRSYLSRFYECMDLTDADCLQLVRDFWRCAEGDYDIFLDLLQMYSSEKPLKYVQSHAYFINKYILENKKECCFDD